MVSIFAGDVPILIQNPIIPVSDAFRPMAVIEPFRDPPNSFRAETVNDLYFITPKRTVFSALEFDVGLDPKIKPIIFSIQNRCLNMTLRISLTLPPYLRSNLGAEFLVPSIGDTQLSPIFFFNRENRFGPEIGPVVNADFEDDPSLPVSIVTPLPVGSGKGLINVTVTFSEAQVKTLQAGTFDDKIIFDIFPNDPISEPVFISTTIGAPKDLNTQITGSFPVDDDDPITTGSVDPGVTVITESIEVEVPVPTLAPGFVAGTDGVTNDGVAFTAGDLVDGAPPTGWTTEADGRAYPPIIPEKECDPTGEEPPDDIPDDELTPLQLLVRQSKDIPPSFGTATRRRGFVLDPGLFLNGTDPDRIIRSTPELVVADSVPGRNDFKIVNLSPNFRNGQTTTRVNPLTNQYLSLTELHTATTKEGERIPFSFANIRNFGLSSALERVITDGDRLEVPREFEDFDELQNFRILSTAASIITSLNNEGAGNPVD